MQPTHSPAKMLCRPCQGEWLIITAHGSPIGGAWFYLHNSEFHDALCHALTVYHHSL